MEKPNIGWTDAADLRHPADIKKIIKYEFVQMTPPVPAGTSKSTMSEVNRLLLFGSYHCISISAGLKKKKKRILPLKTSPHVLDEPKVKAFLHGWK